MKVLKVIPFTYLPMLQEQELHYFTDEENIKKFNAVILKVRGIDTPGIVSEVMDLNSAKIYLKKFYDYELKPIEKLVFRRQLLSDITYKLLGLIEFIWFQPRSLLLKDFFPKFLFDKKAKKSESKLVRQNILNLDTSEAKKFFSIKNRLNDQLKKNKNVLCVFARSSTLEYYLPFFEKYFKGKFKIAWRSYKSEFMKTVNLILNQINKPLIFLTIRDLLVYPINHLGGIYVFDEENPNYEKKIEKPYFNIKKAAHLLSKLHKCDYQELPMMFPSFDNYFRHKKEIADFIRKIKLPRLEFFNLAQPFKERKVTSYFHNKTLDALVNALKNNGRIVILQNRKGYAVFVKCLDCSYVFYCKNCDIPLKLHKKESTLLCHYCNFQRQIPDVCDRCRGTDLQVLGTGVEKIAESLTKFLAKENLEATFFEVDLDTIPSPAAKLKLIKQISQSHKSITIGTSSLLDFRGQSFDLAIIANVDLSFNFPGYTRTMETLYIIGSLYQISKKLIIQTYGDSREFLERIKNNLLEIYEEEDEFRKTFSWPPYVDLIKLIYSLKDKQKAFSRSILERDKIQYFLRQYPLDIQKKFQIFGPNEDIIFRRKGKYHYVIIIKSAKKLRQIRNEILRKVNTSFDIEVEI